MRSTTAYIAIEPIATVTIQPDQSIEAWIAQRKQEWADIGIVFCDLSTDVWVR